MPFGLKNAPSAFQRELRQVLQDFNGRGVELYLDDIIVHTKTVEEHRELLSELFRKLIDEGLKLRQEKCKFFQREVQFLGHVISEDKVMPSLEKTKAIREFPTPSSVRQVMEFLGICNYYRNYIRNFSKLAEPLTRLLKKDKEFQWTDEQKDSFETLKGLLCSEPCLSIYDPKLPMIVETDGSKQGLGAVLMQRAENNLLKTIAFWSYKLNEHERNYSAPELECLAVVKALEHWRVYLEGIKFEVLTDCKAITWLFKIESPSSRLFRWAVRLGVYDFTVHYRPGIQNKVADAFSRNPIISHIDHRKLSVRQHECNDYLIRKPKRINGLLAIRF